MDKDFWLRRWQKGEIGFHNTEPHAYLQRFFAALQAQPGETVFVPLCGKSPDLVWLRSQGLKVVGVELSRMAVDAFFSENCLPGVWTELREMPCCRAEGYQIFCEDFFKLTAAELAGASVVYDRGSLVALPVEMRARYAAHLAVLLPTGSRVLLVSYEYNQEETCGPPFSVSLQEIQGLFCGDFQVEVLAEEDALCSHRGLVARGVSKLTEFAVLLVRK